MGILRFVRGDKKTLRPATPVTDEDGSTDISGAHVFFTVKADASDAEALLSKEGTVTNSAEGLFEVNLVGEDTADLPVSTRLVWDMSLVDIDSEVTTLDSGYLYLISPVH